MVRAAWIQPDKSWVLITISIYVSDFIFMSDVFVFWWFCMWVGDRCWFGPSSYFICYTGWTPFACSNTCLLYWWRQISWGCMTFFTFSRCRTVTEYAYIWPIFSWAVGVRQCIEIAYHISFTYPAIKLTSRPINYTVWLAFGLYRFKYCLGEWYDERECCIGFILLLMSYTHYNLRGTWKIIYYISWFVTLSLSKHYGKRIRIFS